MSIFFNVHNFSSVSIVQAELRTTGLDDAGLDLEIYARAQKTHEGKEGI